MHRFLVTPQELKQDKILLNEKESRHALSVLRLGDGDAVEIFDGEGRSVEGIVVGRSEGRVTVKVGRERAAAASGAEVTLGVSVIKPERMEWLIEKATELGAFAVRPLVTERTIVRLSAERWEGKVARWKKIAAESCKQCGLSRVPRVEEVAKFDTVLKTFSSYDVVLLPTLPEKSLTLTETLKNASSSSRILVLIGPEGDFTAGEIQVARAAGARPVTLGDLTFRSETAAVFMLSVLRFALPKA
jgi:16S rRNA (uracil1498-N3)-methyltransferase